MLVEWVLRSADHERTDAPEATLRAMRDDREAFLTEIRRRWEDEPSDRTHPR
jgi:hypothetical protein